MNPIKVPNRALKGRPNHSLVEMGKPPGVSDADCVSVQMLIGLTPTLPGFSGVDQFAYFKPSERELELLNAGGFIEMNQLGTVVQPFSLSVWPADIPDDPPQGPPGPPAPPPGLVVG